MRPGEGTLEDASLACRRGTLRRQLGRSAFWRQRHQWRDISRGDGQNDSGGTLGAPVREVTVATDFSSLLKGVRDVGGDARWTPLYGSVYAPSLAVEGVTVSGA